jgi:hypothetical protein
MLFYLNFKEKEKLRFFKIQVEKFRVLIKRDVKLAGEPIFFIPNQFFSVTFSLAFWFKIKY